MGRGWKSTKRKRKGKVGRPQMRIQGENSAKERKGKNANRKNPLQGNANQKNATQRTKKKGNTTHTTGDGKRKFKQVQEKGGKKI